jgi:maltose alpha-D-glucosyltransferase/alpha-amylase
MTQRPASSPSIAALPAPASDPLWYKTAVIYEVHIRAFADSNGDGIGDIRGLISHLDYLEDLGVTALWVLPFYPSPLRDGGYDIADYTTINPAYGTMEDFRQLLDEAHRRGIRIITELVLNHTSSDHAWFQRARRAPAGSPERDFYVWSETPERYTRTRIIFKDFESSNWAWDPVAHAYYWHRFYSHQPDLNFDNPAVHQALLEVVDFWFDLGVDGMRLDAIPYLYEREGTNCENLDETHGFLQKLRAHVDSKYQDRMLLAEANQWPVDAAAYFGTGNECHMNFHFPLMPRMFMAVQMEDRFPIVDILRQTPAIPESCQWATFLRNHDELTLEMVTDEERDYMYRVYTEDPVARINLGIRRRLAPLLKGRRRIELMSSLLFSLPGTPVLYYGDEIGMGDNVYLGDRDGVRTPMQWSGDRNAGFSRANPQRLYLPVIIDPEYHYEAVNVEAQQGNPTSLLWWTKRLIALRKEHKVFGYGDIEFLRPDNPKVLAFVRSYQGERVLCVANLSRHPQFAEVDLTAYAGATPVEMFGRTRFPVITDRPYVLSFGPHNFLWFHLEAAAPTTARPRPTLVTTGSWTSIAGERSQLARALASFAAERRWFRGKARTRHGQKIVDVIDLPAEHGRILAVVLEIDYTDGEPELYLVPLGFATGEPAVHLEHRTPHAVVAGLEMSGSEPSKGVLYDALATGEAARALLAIARRRQSVPGPRGAIVGVASAELAGQADSDELQPRVVEMEQSNTTVPFGERLLVKVFRQLEHGTNAELEVGAFLTAHPQAPKVPRVLGSLEYRPKTGEPCAVAVVHEFVANEGSAWQLFLGEVEGVFEKVLSDPDESLLPTREHPLVLATMEPPPQVARLVGQAVWRARQLGARTAEIHTTLAASIDPAFAPEAFTMMHQQSLFQGARAMMVRTFETLGRKLSGLPPEVQDDARAVLAAQGQIERRLKEVLSRPIDAVRVRPHGDLHLGQVLFTGDDFMIIDFEGEPARPLRERRYKRNPLRDVAGMMRSFSYAAESSLRAGRQRAQDQGRLRPWGQAWSAWIGAAYLGAYLAAPGIAPLLPPSPADAHLLLDFYTMDKCIYEVGYELNNRPDWLPIPIHGLLELIGTGTVTQRTP